MGLKKFDYLSPVFMMEFLHAPLLGSQGTMPIGRSCPGELGQPDGIQEIILTCLRAVQVSLRGKSS